MSTRVEYSVLNYARRKALCTRSVSREKQRLETEGQTRDITGVNCSDPGQPLYYRDDRQL